MPTYNKICIDCGKEFIANAHNAKRCKDCFVIAKRVRDVGYHKRNATKTRNNPKTTIFDVLRQVERYNKEHNTCLT